MKRYCIAILVFVLTAALMTGCGCTGPTVDETTPPTILPTNGETTAPTRESTSAPSQESTAETSMPTQPNETIDRGNGPLTPETTEGSGSTESTGINGNGSAGRSMAGRTG